MLIRIVNGACLLAVVGALVSAASCDQKRINCFTANGPYATKFTRISGDSEGPCASLKGADVGILTYHAVGKENKPKLDEPPSVAIQAIERVAEFKRIAAASDIFDESPEHKPYGWGRFAESEPDSNDFCTIPTLTPSELKLPYIPPIPPGTRTPDDPGEPEQEPKDISYTWRNVRLLVTPAYMGTQFIAEFTYMENGCSTTYKVIGVSPSHSCGNEDGTPNPDLCSPVAIPEKQIAVGSGISPDFPVECDPELLVCMLTRDPPALK